MYRRLSLIRGAVSSCRPQQKTHGEGPGAMTQTDYKCSQLTAAPPDDHGQGPVLLHTDDVPASPFAVPKAKRGNVAAWYRRPLGFLKKLKVCSFMCFLTIAFLVTASYMLMVNRKGPLFTPPPPHRFVSPVSPGPGDFNLSATRDLAHIRLVVKSIVSRIEFQSSRRVPERQAVVSMDPHMFSVIPRKFLTGLKNPCWYQEYTGNIDNQTDPYGNNKYWVSRPFNPMRLLLKKSFWEHLSHWDGKMYRIRCLPYFYILGQPKCGTTDLYDRLRRHPDIMFSVSKEPHWWTRKKFGVVGPQFTPGPYPVDDYLDMFDLSAFKIQETLLANASGAPDLPDPQRHIVIGEASASTFWDSRALRSMNDSDNTTEASPFLTQDLIHALQPDALLIVIFRDPVERLYSDYLYFGTNVSVEDFHEKVLESMQVFDGCLAMTTLRSCVYNSNKNSKLPVRMAVGLYVVFILDWLTIFRRDQLLVLRLEDHALDQMYNMNLVLDFLNIAPLTEQQATEITQSPASNTRKESTKTLGPMLAITRELLQDFYKPFNQKLADVLQNKTFLWDSQ